MAFADLVAGADRAVQANLGGEPVTYAPAVGSPVVVTGIYDEQYVLAQGASDIAGVEVSGPAVSLLLADLPTDPVTDRPTITVRGDRYSVIERRPDGMGLIVLALRRIT